MSFVSNPFKFIHFVYFFVLGLKMGLEQNFFNFLKVLLTNKLAKVFSAVLNVIVIIVNCAQFYFLKLKLTFGNARLFMFVAFFTGVFLTFNFVKLLSRIKLKKTKNKTN